jgi:hypothetical protein
MKTLFYTGCPSFISDTNKDCVIRETDGEGVRGESVGVREPKNEKK